MTVRNTVKRLLAFLTAVLILLVPVSQLAFADETEGSADFYETFAEWQSASGVTTPTWNQIVDEMDKLIEHGKESYEAGDKTEAFHAINNAYYGWYETTGFERIAMGYISGSRKTEMELQFSNAKAASKGDSQETYEEECDLLSSMLREDANKLDGVSGDSSDEETGTESGSDAASTESSSSAQTAASVAAFLACFGIILREGFEAILIVGAIAAYLVKTGAKRKDGRSMTGPVYAGAIIGIIASFVSAWLLNLIKLANSASQEVIEGVTALIAVCVLFYVSNWMISKSESEAWASYIKSKAQASSEKGSMFALAFTSFLAVYREGAEVILFYQPMLSGNYDRRAVWAGFIVGCICLVGVYLAIRYLSLTIPLKPFFTATSILMAVMCVAFLGSGIKELIEGDVITIWAPSWVRWIPSNAVLEILGIYPCGQTVIAQIILTIIFIWIFVMQHKKNKQMRAQLIAEHPEVLEQERLAKKATKQDVVDLVQEKLAESGIDKESIQKMVDEAVAKALKSKS